jgi:C4-dicarboxylate-specific signal transduction histidine kinase
MDTVSVSIVHALSDQSFLAWLRRRVDVMTIDALVQSSYASRGRSPTNGITCIPTQPGNPAPASIPDIEDRNRAEQKREQLRQIEAGFAHMNRVSLMGEMATSLAHE